MWQQLFCSLAVFDQGLATPWTYFLHLSLFSVILIDSSTYWCCPSRPCVVSLVCMHLALFHALSLFTGNSWCDHSVPASLLWQCINQDVKRSQVKVIICYRRRTRSATISAVLLEQARKGTRRVILLHENNTRVSTSKTVMANGWRRCRYDVMITRWLWPSRSEQAMWCSFASTQNSRLLS